MPATSGGKAADVGTCQDPPSRNRAEDTLAESDTDSIRYAATDLYVTIDGAELIALLDTGADYSVMSGAFARELRKVLTPWTGAHIRTAGGHVIRPLGMCTARVGIHGFMCTGQSIVLPECSRDLILGVDFLQANGAVINFPDARVTFSTKRAVAHFDTRDLCSHALRIVEDDVTVPPRCSVLVRVQNDLFHDLEGIADSNIPLLL